MEWIGAAWSRSIPEGILVQLRKALPTSLSCILTLATFAHSAQALPIVDLFTSPGSDGRAIDLDLDGTFDLADDAFSPAAFRDLDSDREATRGILEFAILDGISSADTIRQVTLRVESDGQAGSADLLLYSGNGSVDLADANATAASLGTFLVPAHQNVFEAELPIAAFQSLLDDSATHFALRLQSSPGSGVGYRLFGAEQALLGVAPTLRVEIVPEPATAGLLLMGLGALGAAARRRNP